MKRINLPVLLSLLAFVSLPIAPAILALVAYSLGYVFLAWVTLTWGFGAVCLCGSVLLIARDMLKAENVLRDFSLQAEAIRSTTPRPRSDNPYEPPREG